MEDACGNRHIGGIALLAFADHDLIPSIITAPEA
jgi:hypothetical protein